jgi:hypothetical protein
MMNLKASIGALVLLGCGLGYAQFAAAQACPATLTGTLSTASPSANGNNCTNNTNFLKICSNSETLGGGGMDIYQFTLGAGYSNLVFSLNSTAFTPELGIIGAPCSSSTSCIIDNTVAAPGTVTGTLPGALAAGNYFVFVANVTDAACGAYGLSFTGTLPVKLEKFQVD